MKYCADVTCSVNNVPQNANRFEFWVVKVKAGGVHFIGGYNNYGIAADVAAQDPEDRSFVVNVDAENIEMRSIKNIK